MKKLVFLCVVLFSLIGACDKSKDKNDIKPVTLNKFIITDETPIDNCSSRNLSNKIIYFMSKYCPHCQQVKPIIRRIIKEEKLEKYYEEFDLADENARIKFEKCNCFVELQFVPVLVVNCQVLPGARSEKDYTDLLKKFKMSL